MARCSVIAILLLALLPGLTGLCGLVAADDAENSPVGADNAPAENTSATTTSAPGDSAEVVVLDNTKRRLALIYGLFWLIIAIFVGRIAWMLAQARKQLGVSRSADADLPPAQGAGHLQIAPADDPDNPFRHFQAAEGDNDRP